MSFTDWGLGLAGQPGATGPGGPTGGISDAPNDGFFYGRQSLTWVSSGAKYAGTVSIAPTTGNPTLVLNKTAGGNATVINTQVGGTMRWSMQPGNSNAESGSNAGSDFYIFRYSDTGAQLGNPFFISRASGIIQLGDPNIGGSFQVQVAASSAGHARFYMYSSGVRAWSCGAINNAHFYIADESAGVVVADFVPGGGLNIAGGISMSTNISIWGGNITGDYLGFRYYYPGTGSANAIAFQWNGSNVIVVIDNAVAYPIASASDVRLKSDIAPSRFDCLAAIEQIPLCEYRWRKHIAPGTAEINADAPLMPVGVVAQQLHELFPWLVIKGDTHESLRDDTVLADRDRSDPGNIIWDIDKNNALALLTGAVQQLSEQVKTLQAALAQVHGELQQTQRELAEMRDGDGGTGGASAPPVNG